MRSDCRYGKGHSDNTGFYTLATDYHGMATLDIN